MTGNISKPTQELQVLDTLLKANGEWVNGQYFLRTLYLSQYHRAIYNLQNRRDRYIYEGEIEASDFTDEHGFKSYRIKVAQEGEPTCIICGKHHLPLLKLNLINFQDKDLAKVPSKYWNGLANPDCVFKSK